jgi:hypothetical protein
MIISIPAEVKGMSNYRAIATVTAVLQNTLQAAVGSISNATVTMDPLDTPTRNATAQVNLFLYSVAPNPALRNADLPTRRSDGGLATRPQAALELRYLLSFYGLESDLEPQRLLGKVTAVLHSRALITRKAIRTTLAKPAYNFLAGSDLADAVETVRLTPLTLSVEEMARLWSMFPQTPYTLSVAYCASVLLIEAEEFAGPALPVRDYRVYAIPSSRPIIHTVESKSSPRDPILPDSVLVIRGENLTGTNMIVRIAGFEMAVTGEPDQLRFSLADLPIGVLRAGVLGLQVVHPRLLGEPPTPHAGADSNLAAFILHPTLSGGPFNLPSTADVSLSLTIHPPVRARQRAALLLTGTGGAQLRAIRVDIPPANTDRATIAITLPRPPLGRYLVRILVEGAESLPEYDPTLPGYSGPFAFRTPNIEGAVRIAGEAISLRLAEEVLPGQEVIAQLYQQPDDAHPVHTQPIPTESFAEPSTDLTVPAEGIPSGIYWVRVVVDGAKSSLRGPQNAPTGPKVTIP